MIKIIGVLLILLTPLVSAAEKDSASNWLVNAKLFTTPADRSRLDSLRQTASVLALQAQESLKEPEEDETTVLLPTQVHMQGFIKRNDGQKNTVWINHKALLENTVTSDLQVGSVSTKFKSKNKLDGADEISMKLPGNGQTFKLKAGQRYLPEENSVKDLSVSVIPEIKENTHIKLQRKNSGLQNTR
jgi:hypothetical protein